MALSFWQATDQAPDLLDLGAEAGLDARGTMPQLHLGTAMAGIDAGDDDATQLARQITDLGRCRLEAEERVVDDVLRDLARAGHQPGESRHRSPLGPVDVLEGRDRCRVDARRDLLHST